MEVGLASNNSLRFIDVSCLCLKLGPQLAKAMTGFHCFTGCDQNLAFARKGKVRPLTILERSPLYQDAFSSFGTTENINETTISAIGMYVCEMYGFKKHSRNANQPCVDDVRLQLFSKGYQSSATNNPMSKVKGIDGSALPPCQAVLLQEIRRANAICSGWNFATESKPNLFPPEQNGWLKETNPTGVEKFILHWFDGAMVPDKLEDVLESNNQNEEDKEEGENEDEQNEDGENEDEENEESAESDEDELE